MSRDNKSIEDNGTMLAMRFVPDCLILLKKSYHLKTLFPDIKNHLAILLELGVFRL